MKKTAVNELHGVGPAMEKRLGYLNIKTIQDLIWTLPRAYDDRSDVIDIIDIVPNEKVTIRGNIEQIASRRGWKSRTAVTEALVSDSTASLKVVWFNQPYIEQNLKSGDEVFLTGVVKQNKYGTSMQSPEYEKAIVGRSTTHTARIVPTYQLTAGITQKQMRYFVKQALEKVLPINDPLPQEIIEKYNLLSLTDALQSIHFPENNQAFYAAQRRLDFEEMYILQLAVEQMKADLHSQGAPAIPFQQDVVKTFVEHLPYTLTDAQKKTAWAILQDMEKATPMNRLVEGDVGSGKTVVASIAILNTVLQGYQAAFMAPTEIVAKQHYASLSTLFQDYDISIALLTGSEKHDTNASVIVGTHALIQEGVTFHKLALAIIDEQHRFGVAQRKALKESGQQTMPHLLSLSATPIPRTLALTVYGDLDLSVIDEMPVGRKPIITRVVDAQKRKAAYQFIREHIQQGEQAFVICPVIEESEKLRVKAVTTEFERLQKHVFADLRLEMLHGRMKPAEKEDVMNRMRDGEIDVLVTTSVIEVGVDIPNATIIVIEGAERFGLAQLHQFRGRVGRGDKQSYCLLFTTTQSQESIERLQAMTQTNNGFELAQKDLELRGSGEMYGTMQSGFSDSMIHALQQPQLISEAQEAVRFTQKQNLLQKNSALQEKVNDRLQKMHLE